MGKRVLAILLAAVAWTPIAASAQDRGDWGNRGDRQGRAHWSGDRQARGQWSGDRQDRDARTPVATPQPMAQPRAADDRNWRGGDRARSTQGNDGRNGEAQRAWRGATGDRENWNRGDRDQANRGRNGWDRNGQNRAGWDRNGQDRAGWDRGGWDRGGRDRSDWDRDRRVDNDWRQRTADRDSRAWNRDWRQDRRYDWNRYRTANRSAYRLPRYYAPSGWNYGYRRFSVGVRLAPTLFGQNYWIGDPYAYRLPPAYGPYRWVRYYDDALLVDTYSGQVVDVIYGIFW